MDRNFVSTFVIFKLFSNLLFLEMKMLLSYLLLCCTCNTRLCIHYFLICKSNFMCLNIRRHIRLVRQGAGRPHLSMNRCYRIISVSDSVFLNPKIAQMNIRTWLKKVTTNCKSSEEMTETASASARQVQPCASVTSKSALPLNSAVSGSSLQHEDSLVR